jgi:hypothetical protein
MSNEFWAEVNSLLDKTIPEAIEYRVHYNEQGEIYLCTMQNHPVETDYLVVSKDEYDRYFDYRVVDAKLKKTVHDAGYRVQLQQSNTGYKTVKHHASLLVEDEEYTDVEYYEYRKD